LIDLGFEQLRNNRKQFVDSAKRNKFDFTGILAGAYNDPSHFIFEIIQNADDEGASELQFDLTNDHIDIFHNGNDFDLDDITGVTGIGNSKKKEDLVAIGKFGVGFKSVFAITTTPIIFSGKYKFKIENFVVPSMIKSNESYNGTLIRLPFNHSKRSSDDIYSLVRKRLETIDPKTLLFLKRIKKLTWNISGHEEGVSKIETKTDIPSVKRITLNSSTSTDHFLLFERSISKEFDDLKVEVAYKLQHQDNGSEVVAKEQETKLAVFLPTETLTFLNFTIQGPFKTTSNRENIPLEDKENLYLLKEIGKLVSDSIPIMKKLGYLNVNYLEVLPINLENCKNSKIYSVIYDCVKEQLLSGELLPTAKGGFTKASQALLARGRELTEFLSESDLLTLFSKLHWISSEVTKDKSAVLWNYLQNELEVEEIYFEKFARSIKKDFLESKTDKWMIEFYKRLVDQNALWSEKTYPKGFLRTKPIIRLSNSKQHIAPFDDKDRVQVYLPSNGKSEYRTVKRSICKNKEALEFLRSLGLKKPDIYAEIKDFIIPRYQKVRSRKPPTYKDDLNKLLLGYSKVPQNYKDQYLTDLKDAYFIDSVAIGTNKHRLSRPGDVYFNTKELLDYFANSQDVYLVSVSITKKFNRTSIINFLTDLGVEDSPRRIPLIGTLTWQQKLSYSRGFTREISDIDYEYDGLDIILSNITVERSFLLWKMLLKSVDKFRDWDSSKFFNGCFTYFYYSMTSVSFPAKFLTQLRDNLWLVDRDGNFRKPDQIMFSELKEGYETKHTKLEALKKVLGFASEISDNLPLVVKQKYEIVKDVPIATLQKLVSELNKQKKEESNENWKPEIDPDKVPTTITNIEPPKNDISRTTRRQETSSGDNGSEGTKRPIVTETEDPMTKKDIGKWGEEYVYNVLKRDYTGDSRFEVEWLNKDKESGVGYDIVLKESGVEIRYIEVKSKTVEHDELIEVTGTQWEFARSLYEQGKGDSYFFYIVRNPGKNNAKIEVLQNPIKLWKEGRLYAHPVNFKL
jgi:hypothetical protein